MKSNRTVLKDQYYQKVIDLYTKEHLSMWQISKIIPLDRSTIWRWISTFAAYDQESCVMEKKEIETPDSLEQPDDAEPMPDDIESLQAEVKRLRRELTKAEIKAEAYDEMINVAESQFNIRIRKKAGAKQ